MRKLLLRGLWFRSPRRSGNGAGQLLLSALLGLGAALFLIHQFDAALRPQLAALAQAQLRNQITQISNAAVMDALAQLDTPYSETEIIPQGESGGLSLFSTDMLRLNRLRCNVMETIVSQVETLDSRSLGVPLGALTGIDILSGIGPDLPVQVLSVATADGVYRNDFVSAGINQTLHRVLLDVTVTAEVLMPGGIVETTVSIPVFVSEAVIVGQVPQTYMNWYQ